MSSDPEAPYNGYTTTRRVQEIAGVEDDKKEWPNSYVNKIIKGVENMINNKTKQTFTLGSAPSDIEEAAAYIAGAVIAGEVSGKDNVNYKTLMEIGMMFLSGYLENPAAVTAGLGTMVLSDYLTEPANPEAPKYITGQI